MSLIKTVVTITLSFGLFISCSADEDIPEKMAETIVENEMSSTDDMNMEEEMLSTDDMDSESEMTTDEENETNGTLASGTLQTSSDYPTAGNFEISETNELITLELDSTFSVEGGLPDLVIYLSNVTDSQENAILISDTAADSGMQILEIPANVDYSTYKYVLLYCRQYNLKVGFGEIIQSSIN